LLGMRTGGPQDRNEEKYSFHFLELN
jgi:hypothetical protein